MEKLTIEEVKEIQINILKFVDAFCKENKINYWIDSGTLLGAIRHKGYIPWDDDIDIGMLREDYDKFSSLFNKKNSRYVFDSIEINPNCFFPYGKVYDISTVLFEPDENGIKTHVNIDVFIYDNAPNSLKITKKMYEKRDLFNFFRSLSTRTGRPHGNFLKRIIEYFLRFIARFKKQNWYAKKIIKNSKKYCKKSTGYVGNFTAMTKIHSNKRIFDGFIDVEFEGHYFPSPIGYNEWLTDFYNNYMNLPPLEKRVSHHKFIAYRDND